MASPGLEKVVKSLTLTIVGVGIFAMLSLIFLVGYGVHRINQAIPLKPDPDLSALEQLLTRKIIVLTREQKEKLAPIVRDLTQNGNVPEKVKNLKEKMWNVLDSKQIKSIKDWKDRASKQAGEIMEDSNSELRGTIHKYKLEIKQDLTDEFSSINDKFNSIHDKFNSANEKYNSTGDKWWFNGDTRTKSNLLKMLE